MAAGSTYTPIATYTAGSNFTSYTFSSIPSTYTDLHLVIVTSRTSSGVNPSLTIQFNGDTGTNYSMTKMRGTGTSALSNRESNSTAINFSYFSMNLDLTNPFIIDVMNYSNTTTYKTAIGRSNASGSGTEATVGLWRSTSAINSLTINNDGGGSYLLAGTTATLYGIAAA